MTNQGYRERLELEGLDLSNPLGDNHLQVEFEATTAVKIDEVEHLVETPIVTEVTEVFPDVKDLDEKSPQKYKRRRSVDVENDTIDGLEQDYEL